VDVFGSGGGQTVADALTKATGTKVTVLGQIPIDVRLREGSDNGEPIVLSAPESAAAQVLIGVADKLAARTRGLVGMSLSVSPVRK
jgi:ATP-binding protein involved in chromosome partitioning